MRGSFKLDGGVLALVLGLASVRGQYVDTGAATQEEAANATSGGFQPPFPVHCRPIDFDEWNTFGPTEDMASPAVITRCQNLYADPKLQPGAASAESEKLCKESYADYSNWQTVPGDSSSKRMFCDVALMNIDLETVKMRHYLETKLVSQALTVDHDIMREFLRWIDDTNLRLFDSWKSGDLFGEEAPKVSDACANAYGDYLCSNVLPNCTYMPDARWPYHESKEKIYVCKEICERVQTYCNENWLPAPMRCKDLVSTQRDRDVDPDFAMTAFERRDAGGHPCSYVVMSERYQSGTDAHAPTAALGLVLMAALWYSQEQ